MMHQRTQHTAAVFYLFLLLVLMVGPMLPVSAQAESEQVAVASANGNTADSGAEVMCLESVIQRLEAQEHSAVVMARVAQLKTLLEEHPELSCGEYLGDAEDADAEQTPSTAVASAEPRTSSASAVASDKLILNEPVVDEANILTAQEKQQLSQQLRELYNQGLAQAAVVIVPTTDGVPAFDYAMDVAERWELGEADTDEGLLILVAVNDRDIQILTGYGLEGVLPDAVLSRIIREDITPYFRQNDYAGGLSAAISRMETRLTSDPEALARADAAAETQRQSERSNSGGVPFPLLIIGFVLGVILTNVFGRIVGPILTSVGVFGLSVLFGFGILASLGASILLGIILAVRGFGFIGGGGGGGSSSGGFGGGGFSSGGGGFSGGGFGGGGFSGGGGGFGGGGAGGSW